MRTLTRRNLLTQSAAASAAILLGPAVSQTFAAEKPGAKIKLGLCTYMWGAQWDLPTLIANWPRRRKSTASSCEPSIKAWRVEPSISTAKRKEVKKRFADSRVTFIGLGTNGAPFTTSISAAVEKAIERSKAFLKLSHELGGGGVKVKPNELPKGMPQKKTTEQIGRARSTRSGTLRRRTRAARPPWKSTRWMQPLARHQGNPGCDRPTRRHLLEQQPHRPHGRRTGSDFQPRGGKARPDGFHHVHEFRRQSKYPFRRALLEFASLASTTPAGRSWSARRKSPTASPP